MTAFTIKISLGEDIRRISLTQQPSLKELKDVFQKLFIQTTLDNYIIKYKDEEGDLITVSCDLELTEAFLYFNHFNILRMTLVLSSNPVQQCSKTNTTCLPVSPGPIVHRFFLCDGCDMAPIVGTRWKCSQCPNYDLCSDCYEKGIHKELGHTFVTVDPQVCHRRKGLGKGCRKGLGKGCRKGLGNGSRKGLGNGCRKGLRNGGCKRRSRHSIKDNVDVIPDIVKPSEPITEEEEVALVEVVPDIVKPSEPIADEVASVVPPSDEEGVDIVILKTLIDMGFSNEELLRALLINNDNNLLATLNELM